MTAFGVNAVVVPPGYTSGRHLHERQEELYFVHRGTIEFTFGDGDDADARARRLRARRPATVRSLRNTSETEEAVYVCVGGAGGYVGRDGLLPEGEAEPALAEAAAPARRRLRAPAPSRSRISVSSFASSDGRGRVAASSPRAAR